MSRLLCFGDSFTFGHGLPDAEDYYDDLGNYVVITEPSGYSWPAVLAKLTEQNLVNAGSTGASNREIWHTILCTHFEPTDDVVVMWTHHHRTCKINSWIPNANADKFVWEPRPEGKYWNTDIKSYGNWMDHDPAVMEYYKHHWESHDSQIATLLYINHIQLYLSPRVNSLTHAFIPNSPLETNSYDPMHWDIADSNQFYDTTAVYNSHDKTSCGHLGVEACEQVAKDIHKIMLDKQS